MPVKIVQDGERFHLIFETKWQGSPMTLGVSGVPNDGYASKAEAIAAKRKVSIIRSGGITAATLLL